MHLASSTSSNLSRALSSKTAPRQRTRRRAANASRLWEALRQGWRKVEGFLVDYYRACGVVAREEAPEISVRKISLRAGEILTLEGVQRWKNLEVRSGEMWLTQTPAENDLLLGAGDRFELGEAFPVVIEALGAAEIVLRG